MSRLPNNRIHNGVSRNGSSSTRAKANFSSINVATNKIIDNSSRLDIENRIDGLITSTVTTTVHLGDGIILFF